MALSKKQQDFIDAYLSNGWNATRAAIAAGYSEKTARFIGSENLTKPNIQAEIKRRLEDKAMGSEEVLARLAEQVRFDPSQYFVFKQYPIRDEEGNPTEEYEEYFVGVDFAKLRDDGLGHLIKSVSPTRNHGWKVEWVDPQRAIEMIGKHLGLFRERVEHSGHVDIDIDVANVTQMSDGELEQLAKRLGISRSD